MSTNLSDTSHINDNLAKDLSHIIYALFSHSSTELNSFETCYAHASRIVARGELSRDRVSDLLRSEPEEIAQAHARVYQWLEEGPSGRKISFQELGFDKHPTSASKDTTSQPSKVPPARSSTTKPLADFDSQRFKQDMMAWILKGAEFPTWTPDPNEDGAQDVKSMRLPCLLDGRGPQMLLHNLSCFEEQAYDLLYPPMERGAKNHKMFINASGSGKTRLCFELLHSKFGFYFTCALHSESTSLSAIGSRDYASMVNDLRRDPDLVQDMTHHPTNSLTCLSESNRAIAHRRLVALLAARFRVCQLFLSCFPRTALLSPKVKRGWLFLQIQPGLINPKGVDVDVFEEAYKYFASRSIGESERYIEKALDTGSRTHTVFSEKSAQDIVIVIDEAQMATDILPRAFLSQTKPFDSGLPMWRSILRETIVCWRSLPTRTLVKNLIVTGTGLSMEKFEELKDSAAVKPQHWTMVHETGSFSTAEEQWQYAVKFLPKSVVRTNGPSIRLLRFRMWHWLRGRHRWTANFMQYLLTYLVFDGQGLQIMFNQRRSALARHVDV
ncbi:hypothetical protein CYLTODRAFT_208974 [Cylindrobasidium torrendii FP15055 ss-10]|uniref:Uncharacterized protein n=1 Tax=Cylindrobasidium torrendii FP15055 ss-10 TaxID=1314674 RepID=A0A0D7BHI3_9AGAR|nr:hypothetical protein CYLTODRAFT_208974 [Cylindrobasidium torrendii FP15055 ss-10]